jgi:ribonucleoside-diphosphate reductase alpha chain
MNIYTRDEVYTSTLEYFKGDTLAAEVWINKYCLKDSDGNLYELNPDDMHRRLANELGRIEKKYPNPLSPELIYNKIKNFTHIVPQGSPMSGIGNNFQITSISNCFVIGNEGESDSYGGILKLDQEIVQLQKRRAGVGVDLSFIRPKGSSVKNSALTSTGIVPFMERYSNTTREVAQDGRRGALMESMSVKHPDIEEFIDAKMVDGKVTGANVSVKLTDQFMKAAMEDTNFVQQFPVDASVPEIARSEPAKPLWDKIIHNAWKSAEPGILFWDNLIKESIPDCYADKGFKTISTNPCGEIPLCANDSCRLLAMNLFGYVKNPFKPDASFNWELFKRDIAVAQRLMDDIIDLELEKIDGILAKIDSDPESAKLKATERDMWTNIKLKAKQGRRTGLGITAEGDMLAALGFRYGSEGSLNFSERVHKMLKLEAYRSSVRMAEERGAFPMYDSKRETENPFITRIREEDKDLYDRMTKYGRRNIALLTIAPTGTTSLMTQTSSGIEPVFMVSYMRRKKVNPQDKDARIDFTDEVGDSWTEYPVFHHNFELWLKVSGYNIDKIKSMTADEINEIVKLSPYYKSTSNDIDWVKKVEMQGRIQKHVDHSISVTVNLPKDVSEQIVSDVYETGWRSGCKGITVYRDGSRSGVLVTESEKKQETVKQLFDDNHAPKRPKRLNGEIIRFQNNHEKWIGVVGLLEGRPYEIFTGRLENGLNELPTSVKECEIVKRRYDNGKSHYDMEYTIDGELFTYNLSESFNPEYWNYAKLISSVLRHGMPILYVQNLIQSLNLNDAHLNTWKNGMSRVIKKYIKDGQKVNGTCPNCGGSDLKYMEGCLSCQSCGNAKCGT